MTKSKKPDTSGAAGGPASEDRPIGFDDVLDSIRATAYRWDFATDRVDWAKNAGAVLGGIDIATLRRGRAFALHIDPEHAAARYDGVTGGAQAAADAALPYALRYRFLPKGRRGREAVWVEDHGVCFTDAAGRPVRAQGTIRVIGDRRRSIRETGLCASGDRSGLMNRTELTEDLARLLSNRGGRDTKGAFLLAVINDLTRVNETYGYDIGDEVISIAGQRLAAAVRGRDALGRFSSNTFGVVLHNCDGAYIESVARRMIACVEGDVVTTSAGSVVATLSVGAVQLPDHAGTAHTAIGRALKAVDKARTSAGDHFCCYDPSAREEAERRRNIAIADEIIRALNDRRMMIALQPIVASRNHDPEYFECLLRLRLPDGSVMDANEFVPVAEEFGLSKLIDHRALELAVDLLRTSPDWKLALNVSALSTTDRHWADALEALTGKDRTLTERLTVEVGEAAAIADMEATAAFVRDVREAGCKVALDDFGAGYASFRSLRNLGVDIVKIDGTLIESLGADERDETFVQALVELAHSFGLATVGEWVGDERSVELLEKAGVSFLQGNFFGAPELYEDKAAAKKAG
ncbi:EAL domain-containing protein [Methyloceanibacter sp.]|uniref:EAL domain-containing protein n=1 Tax=Methyloceanibacter sp. TaxID=1965321 RepID=UPI002C9B7200|nr:EAL domain-containing protein [Methyloceanibacter sp.]HML93133.1 EAL domain-containing protein [Methyloceanibacter sp.]